MHALCMPRRLLRVEGDPSAATGRDQGHVSHIRLGGHIAVLLWARSSGCPEGARACFDAARKGHLEVIKWERVNRSPWAKGDWMRCLRYATERGHLPVMEWIKEQGRLWRQHVCDYAARGGQLEALKWARANGCPWGVRTCEHAAAGGYLEVLKWATENGRPLARYYPHHVSFAAARGHHLATLEWLLERGCAGGYALPFYLQHPSVNDSLLRAPEGSYPKIREILGQ